MLFGLQIGLFRRECWRKAVRAFLAIQEDLPLQACELHLEAALYEAAIWPSEEGARGQILAALRPAVRRLGVHLPFIDIVPLSPNPRIARASIDVLEDSIRFAASLDADYVVFHARTGSASPALAQPDDSKWLEVIEGLASKACEEKLTFCLENADDLRQPDRIRRILDAQRGNVKFCLDIGHLYERVYPQSRLPKGMLIFNDMLSPVPFAWKRGLPVATMGSWAAVLASFREDLYCLHLHNHDGKSAHRPLRRGKIDLSPLRDFREGLGDIPLILEADYRDEDIQLIRDDVSYLEELLCS